MLLFYYMNLQMSELIKNIPKNQQEISFDEIAFICIQHGDTLPQSRADIYFLIILLKGLKFLEKQKSKNYKINWDVVKNGL